ncbi:hypothetical protein Egran_02265 [Elaphomyces granulatus]|uniref:Uncharacterized protein n=1 Tax=Elaphomyces granulatus TaxID=519963 RepID=A0A232M0T8_9EURO|nr:hypothetical protein Egran_02265 [Elaphomyces granulatus]
MSSEGEIDCTPPVIIKQSYSVPPTPKASESPLHAMKRSRSYSNLNTENEAKKLKRLIGGDTSLRGDGFLAPTASVITNNGRKQLQTRDCQNDERELSQSQISVNGITSGTTHRCLKLKIMNSGSTKIKPGHETPKRHPQPSRSKASGDARKSISSANNVPQSNDIYASIFQSPTPSSAGSGHSGNKGPKTQGKVFPRGGRQSGEDGLKGSEKTAPVEDYVQTSAAITPKSTSSLRNQLRSSRRSHRSRYSPPFSSAGEPDNEIANADEVAILARVKGFHDHGFQEMNAPCTPEPKSSVIAGAGFNLNAATDKLRSMRIVSRHSQDIGSPGLSNSSRLNQEAMEQDSYSSPDISSSFVELGSPSNLPLQLRQNSTISSFDIQFDSEVSNYPWNRNPIAFAIWIAQKVENIGNESHPQNVSSESGKVASPQKLMSPFRSNNDGAVNIFGVSPGKVRNHQFNGVQRHPKMALARSQRSKDTAGNAGLSFMDPSSTVTFEKMIDLQAKKIAPKIQHLAPFNPGFSDVYWNKKAKELRLHKDTVTAGKLLTNVLPALISQEESHKRQSATNTLIHVLDREMVDSPRFMEALQVLSTHRELLQGAKEISAQVSANEVLIDFDSGNMDRSLSFDGHRSVENGFSIPSPSSFSTGNSAAARTSRRIRKPTAKAIESLQQKPKARKRKTESSKFIPPAIGQAPNNEHLVLTPVAPFEHQDNTVTSDPNASHEPSGTFLPYSTEEEYLANQLFELASAAFAPDSEISRNEEVNIERIKEEYYASRQVTVHPNPTETATVSVASTKEHSLGELSFLDHPNLSRPWTDDYGWTHTGHVNEFGEEYVLVPDTYVWIRPNHNHTDSTLFQLAPRLKSCEQAENDRIYGFPPLLGERNLPSGNPHEGSVEDVELETSKIKAREAAVQRGLIVDRSMSLASIEAKIKEHDNPGSSKGGRPSLRLILVDSRTGERRQTGISPKISWRRQTIHDTTGVSEGATKTPKLQTRLLSDDDVTPKPKQRSLVNSHPQEKRRLHANADKNTERRRPSRLRRGDPFRRPKGTPLKSVKSSKS